MSNERAGLSGDDLNRLFAVACDDLAAERFAEARDTCRLLLDFLPAAAILHYNLGLACFGLGAFAEARDAFVLGALHAPADTSALFYLALCQKRLGDTAAAITAYRRVLELAPEQTDCLFNLASCYRDSGDSGQAITGYRRVLDLDDSYLTAAAALAHLHHARGEIDEAARWYNHLLARQPGDEAARYLLDALTGTPHEHAPESYVRGLFDSCAAGFEQTLVTDLGYDNPAQLHACLQRCPGHLDHYAHGLDLGCGTGLSGLPFCGAVGLLDGVDLSVNMLALARDKGCYAVLHTDSIAHHLQATTERYDLFIATDVFIYIGDLRETFVAAAGAARPGALFCCSTETLDRGNYQLRATGRYAYSRGYLTDTAATAGWTVLTVEPTSLRREGDERIAGDLWVLRLDQVPA